jgi:hypothetical protein
MQAEYVFLLRSEVKLALGEWEPLSFRRSGFEVRIEKPISDTGFYIKIRPSGGPIVLEVSRLRPGWGLAVCATMVSIQLESPQEVREDRIGEVFQPVAQGVFNHFKSWIRVLTRQHWIGYQESAFPRQDFNVNVMTGGQRKPLGTGTVGLGFD